MCALCYFGSGRHLDRATGWLLESPGHPSGAKCSAPSSFSISVPLRWARCSPHRGDHKRRERTAPPGACRGPVFHPFRSYQWLSFLLWSPYPSLCSLHEIAPWTPLPTSQGFAPCSHPTKCSQDKQSAISDCGFPNKFNIRQRKNTRSIPITTQEGLPW